MTITKFFKANFNNNKKNNNNLILKLRKYKFYIKGGKEVEKNT